MTIEQKAKAYDEALKKAKDMLSYKEVRREDMEYLFPELKESEDERIKKRILLSLQKDIMATKNSGCNTKDLEECIAWLEKQGEQKPAEWSEEDKAILEKCIGAVKVSCYSYSFKSEAENWLKSLKYRVQPQPKQEWSEEYERNLNDAILFIETGTYSLDKDNLIDWLKSLKERYTWKPSDVQMGAIKDAIDYLGGNTIIVRKHLISLYDQLEKLKG